MSDLIEHPAAPPVSAETLEHVLATGDLAKLTPPQRLEYMLQTCKLIGLNPLTRPFRFLSFQGQVSMYATKDATDQLRRLHKVSLSVVDKALDQGVYVVTVRAQSGDGRHDEDIGAVQLGNIVGEGRANAMMRALTKAKRRATLSICGLGFIDESDLDGMPGAMTFDADAPVVPMPQEQTRRQTTREWLDEFERDCAKATTEAEANEILQRERVIRADEWLPDAAKGRFLSTKNAMLARVFQPPADEQPAA
jgi:hypothetical protein